MILTWMPSWNRKNSLFNLLSRDIEYLKLGETVEIRTEMKQGKSSKEFQLPAEMMRSEKRELDQPKRYRYG